MANTISRSLHDVGLAAWFGGTLANAVALNPAAGAAGSDENVGRVTNAGWDRWTPVNAAAIGAHLAGSVGQLLANRDRVAAQKGVATMAIVKTVVTGAALGATALSRYFGQKLSSAEAPALKDGTTAHPRSTPEVTKAAGQLRWMQWAVPALTGALIVVSSLAGEQQRPQSVAAGIAARLHI